MNLKQYAKEHTLRCIIGAFFVGLFAVGGGMLMDKASASPKFCGMCHAMQHEAKTHATSSHADIACVECHLPHDNIAVYYLKRAKQVCTTRSIRCSMTIPYTSRSPITGGIS